MKATFINPIIFIFTLLPFIWFILIICSSPFTTTLQVARIYDADGKALIDMGVLGGCAKVFDELAGHESHGPDCKRKAPGWLMRPFFPYINLSGEVVHQQEELIRMEDTFPLIIFPIATGMIGIVLGLYIAAWFGGSRKWARTLHITNFSFYVISTAVAWVAFGMCIRISNIINSSLVTYNSGGGNYTLGTPSLAIPLVAKSGNATWLALTSSILLLLATILYGVKIFAKRAPTEQDQYHVQNPKPFGADDTSSS